MSSEEHACHPIHEARHYYGTKNECDKKVSLLVLVQALVNPIQELVRLDHADCKLAAVAVHFEHFHFVDRAA